MGRGLIGSHCTQKIALLLHLLAIFLLAQHQPEHVSCARLSYDLTLKYHTFPTRPLSLHLAWSQHPEHAAQQ